MVISFENLPKDLLDDINKAVKILKDSGCGKLIMELSRPVDLINL